MVQLLFDLGADIHGTDHSGMRALHFATVHGQYQTAELALSLRAGCLDLRSFTKSHKFKGS